MTEPYRTKKETRTRTYDVTVYECMQCLTTFDSDRAVERHIQMEHRPPPPKREGCYYFTEESPARRFVNLLSGDCRLSWSGPGWYTESDDETDYDGERWTPYVRLDARVRELESSIAELTESVGKLRELEKVAP